MQGHGVEIGAGATVGPSLVGIHVHVAGDGFGIRWRRVKGMSQHSAWSVKGKLVAVVAGVEAEIHVPHAGANARLGKADLHQARPLPQHLHEQLLDGIGRDLRGQPAERVGEIRHAVRIQTPAGAQAAGDRKHEAIGSVATDAGGNRNTLD